MLRLTQINRAILALCASGLAAGVAAQPQPPAVQQNPGGQTLEKVEVTGSRIKRIDTETSSPVQVVTREQIERSGAFSVTEVLKRTPSANAGSFDENAVASFTPGAGGVSLRGLGVGATLVLINGRRVAPFGFASGGQTTFVDINQIPVDVVERIEILLDGASAIYGSDAIGGVINVILRKDFNGLQASGQFGRSTHGDANAKRGSLTYGKGSLASDGYNFFVNYSHIDQDPVKANQRELTQTSDFRRFGLVDRRSSYAYGGNLYAATGASGGAFIGPVNCTPIQEAGAAVNNRCYYAGTDHQDVIANSQRDAVTVAGTASLGRGFELFGDATFGRTKFKQESPSYGTNTYGPASTGTLAQNYIPLPVGHPQNPTAATAALRYRFADVQHETASTSDTQRGVLGVRNNDLYGWDFESGLLYSHSSTKINTTGLINDNVLLNEVLDPAGNARPTFIFGNPSANDPALIGRLYPTLRDKGTTSTIGLDVRGSREIYTLPAGPLSLAVGAEIRHEKYSSVPDALTASGALSVLGASSSEGGRTVTAGYAELSIPILKTLEASLAARYDHYSDFGSTTNPKVGLKWKALPGLAFRGTYATGFRAPAITELSQSPSRGFYSGIRDPRLCPDPVATPDNPNCDLSIEALSGSNPKLQPEKAKSLTAGLIFEPLDNVSIALDFYRIKRRNEINSIDPDYLLANESAYPGYVVRNPDGTIKSLNLVYTNLGSTYVWGYDLDIKGSANVGEIGKVSASLVYNRLPHYWVANVAGAPEVDYAGTYTQPKDRVGVSVSLDRGPWSTSLTFNYTGKYLRAFTPADLSCTYTGTANEGTLCTVGSYLTTDLFVGYKGFKNLELGLTIINLDNRQPPIDERQYTRATAFNPTYHSDLGRYFQLGAKYTFW